MKKNIALFAALMASLLLFAACGSSNPSSKDTNSQVSVAAEPSKSTAADSTVSLPESTSVTQVENSDSSLADMLVMDNNENLIKSPGAIMFSTPSSIDDTIDFYKQVLATLNASGDESRDTTAVLDTWAWSGTYDSGTLDILVTNKNGAVGVAISYT